MSKQTDGIPAAEEQTPQRYILVEDGIYRYTDKNGDDTYHERPWQISKKGTRVRTYRSLGHGFKRQTNLAAARAERGWRQTELDHGRNPYQQLQQPPSQQPQPQSQQPPPQQPQQQQLQPQQPAKPKTETAKPTVSEVVKLYVGRNYPDRYLRPRAGRTLEGETACCKKLLEYCGPAQPWDGLSWDSLKPELWDDYHDWRLEQINGPEDDEGDEDAEFEPQVLKDEDEEYDLEPEELKGDRAVDLERNSLNNAFKYALRKGKIASNPVPVFPRFRPPSAVRHCREFQPQHVDEVHQIAGMLFAKRRTEPLAWQLLIEASSALRTSEVLRLRVDAKGFGQPGFIDDEDNLHVKRLKHGINPFVHLNDGLKEILAAHAIWHAARFPDNPWFIPGTRPGRRVGRRKLAHALYMLREEIGRKVTSHGMRAFYVMLRRSWGIDDGVIAVELGLGSGAELIARTYGAVPANWRNGGGPRMSWLPTGERAWAALARSGWPAEQPQELAVAA